MNPSSADREPLEILADDFIERRRRGESPNIREYTEKHPELAEQIKDLFPTLQLMAEADPGTADLKAGSASTVGDAGRRKPERLGDYRILQEIGRGAMGVVYEAEQQSLGRRVALKVLPRQFATEQKALVRFRREARAAARLHHTNIVPVFEVGQDGDTFFYAMQYIQGQSLDKVLAELRSMRGANQMAAAAGLGNAEARTAAISLCRGQFAVPDGEPDGSGGNITEAEGSPNPQDGRVAQQRSQASVSASTTTTGSLSGVQLRLPAYFRSIAEIGAQAASALSYAHERNTVHRDIKPSNLLLDTNGVLWVADFGLAKFEDDGHTRTGDLVGTLRYMSPERFRGQCDPRADVYSLGVTLYEMLLLGPAFTAMNQLEIMDQISNLEPRRPRAVDARIPRDLETIVMKAMEKEPAKRYPSARDMAEDLRRFLEDEPILARKVSPAERFVRWARRNRAVASLTAASFSLLTMLAVVLGAFAIYLQEANQRTEAALKEAEAKTAAEEQAKLAAQAAEKNARQNQYISDMYAAAFAWEANNIVMVERLLDRYLPQGRQDDLRRFEWYYLWRLWNREKDAVRVPLPYLVNAIARSPNEKLLAVGDAHGEVNLLDRLDDGTWCVRRRPLLPPKQVVWNATRLRFSANGKLLVHYVDGLTNVDVWEITDKGDVKALPSLTVGSNLVAAEFALEGSLLAAALSNGSIELWDIDRRVALDPIRLPPGTRVTSSLAFSKDGHLVFGVREIDDDKVLVWNLESKKPERTLSGHSGTVWAVACSPDGRLLATGGANRSVLIWDLLSGNLVRTLPPARDVLNTLSFCPVSRRLAVASRDGSVRVWSVPDFDEVDVARGYNYWSVPDFDEVDVARGYNSGTALCFLRDGRLAYGGQGGNLVIRTLGSTSGTDRLRCEGFVRRIAFSPQGGLLVAVSGDGQEQRSVRRWRWNGEEVAPLSPIQCNFDVGGMAFSDEGSLVIGDSGRCRVEIVDASTATSLRTFPEGKGKGIACLAVSRGGTFIAVGTRDGKVVVWDAAKKEIVFDESVHESEVRDLCFCADDRTLWTGSTDCTLRLWDILDKKQLWASKKQRDTVYAVACSEDGKTLAAASYDLDSEIRLWDRSTLDRSTLQEKDFVLRGHRLAPCAVAFLGDGNTLVSAGEDQTLRFWDLATGQERMAVKTDPSILTSLAVSPDEMSLVAGCRDGKIRIFRRVP